LHKSTNPGSEERFRSLLETTSDWIWEVDKKGRYTYSSPMVTTLLGYKVSEIIGKTPFDLMPADESKRISAIFKMYLKKKQPIIRLQNWNLHKNGNKILLETSGVPFFDARGNLCGYRGIDRDITNHVKAQEEVNLFEQRYRNIIESIPVGMHIYRLIDNKRLVFIGANPSADKILGVDNRQFIGKTIEQAFPALVKSKIPAAYRKVARGGALWRTDQVEYHENKISGAFEVTAFQTSPGHMVAAFSDITQRKKDEAALKASEEKYRNLYGAAPVGLCQLKYREGTLLAANQALIALLGYDSFEDLKATFDPYAHLLTGKRTKEIVRKLRDEGKIDKFEVAAIKKDSTQTPVEISAVVYRDQGIVEAVVIDISKRIKIETELRESEHKYRNIFDNIRDIYFEATLKGKILEISPSVEDIIKYSSQELVGNSMEILFLNPLQKNEFLEELMRKGEIPDYEVILKDKDGSPHVFSLHAVILHHHQKKLTQKIIGSLRDRSESKFLQEQLHQAQKMEAVGRLAGGIAHDFNNLLTVIQGYADLTMSLLNQKDPIYANIQEISKSASRAEALTRQLLTFSRKQIVQSTVLSLNSILKEMQIMLLRLIGEDIKLELNLEHKPGYIKADPGQIEQVIMNLVVNARDAMPNGGFLHIETSNIIISKDMDISKIKKLKQGNYILLVIRDTGIGMDKKTLEHIFEPFFTTKDISKGTGMGLSTAYGIVKQNNGYIQAESEPGHGSIFKIYFPRVDEIPAVQNKNDISDEELTGTETILVVEDEVNLRQLVTRSLNKHGYKTLEAAHGGSALLICEQEGTKIDLILCDVIMPEMKGPELVQRLQKVQSNMRVLFMSGYTDSSINLQNLPEKNKQYIQKPFTQKALLKKIRDVLGSPA